MIEIDYDWRAVWTDFSANHPHLAARYDLTEEDQESFAARCDDAEEFRDLLIDNATALCAEDDAEEEKAAARSAKADELSDLESQVCSLAEEHGWEVARTRQAGTGTIYMTLERECGGCILGDVEAECTCQILTVRVSDHGSAHCSEHVSLIIPSGSEGGDDHTIEYLAKRLA